ncbi:hypothetical protein K0M31_003576 [Melipona bicolor]|uniref:Uncharacterized protein n=1 Tax=Melipona bicolor TaxID=60889 RepID=A0AA40FZF9_9HYME|nr:hypothetical protein K0M31_003576 [Melipona bicolor]
MSGPPPQLLPVFTKALREPEDSQVTLLPFLPRVLPRETDDSFASSRRDSEGSSYVAANSKNYLAQVVSVAGREEADGTEEPARINKRDRYRGGGPTGDVRQKLWGSITVKC